MVRSTRGKNMDERLAPALRAPRSADSAWREKAIVAERARREALAAREGKPTSFGPISGYVPRSW